MNGAWYERLRSAWQELARHSAQSRRRTGLDGFQMSCS